MGRRQPLSGVLRGARHRGARPLRHRCAAPVAALPHRSRRGDLAGVRQGFLGLRSRAEPADPASHRPVCPRAAPLAATGCCGGDFPARRAIMSPGPTAGMAARPMGADMSDEARNVAILQDAYRRWSESRGGSVDHWMSVCAEDIKFGSIAEQVQSVAYMTSYRKRDELGQYFAGLARDWEMIEYRADHFVAQGDRVVMLGYCS